MAGAEGYQMEAAVLAAPVVKDREVLRLRRDAAGRRDVTGLVRTIVAAAPPPDSTTRAAAAGAFNVLDLGEVARLFAAWWRGLRGVRPYYAVKCNPNPALLGALAGLGAGFDCASRAEMEAVLALGVAADRVVYVNLCKLEPHLEYAAGVGVDLTTFDSEEEVGKIKRCHPGCRLLLRIKAPDGDDGGGAMLNLGTKYGAHRDEVVPLLAAARRAGMAVVGVSFHVGSAVSRVGIYAAAIEAARAGGGGGGGESTFQEASAVISAALARHFGGDDMPSGVEVIAEPGRYFAETAFALAARIFGKRTRGEVRVYWIDDGMFGTLCCVHFENYVPRPAPVTATADDGDEQAATMGGEMMITSTNTSTKTHPSTVFGPTLDSFDEVVRGYQLPELCTGDWLVFDDVGAYTTVCSSDFNGFSTSNMKTYLAYSC
uniref:ornithine decarboxylase n=1 Tax=Oryza glumipatula TaxID=40148 RepID=A0A0D9YSC8_9ORYZ